jgi:hypothetical protein
MYQYRGFHTVAVAAGSRSYSFYSTSNIQAVGTASSRDSFIDHYFLDSPSTIPIRIFMKISCQARSYRVI